MLIFRKGPAFVFLLTNEQEIKIVQVMTRTFSALIWADERE